MEKLVQITENSIKAAYDVADAQTKRVLDALFGSQMTATEKLPTLDDYTSIKTYEDACTALGIEPMDGDSVHELPTHIVALLKLETISRALWGRTYQPQPTADGSNIMYYPWFALYTEAEISGMDDEHRGCLLAARADDGAGAGFGCLGTGFRSSYSSAGVGFRLCQETEDKAEYLGKQFLELWAEYLAFNFECGERLK